MKKLLFFSAITAWIIALIVHIISFTGIDITDKLPPIWMVFASIFVLLIPAILIEQKNKELKIFQQSGMLNQINPFAFFKIFYKKTPAWLTTIAIASQVYALINFILLWQMPLGNLYFNNGQHILMDHGRVIKTMTEQEFHDYRANLVRVLSGFCLVFYAGSAAILFPFNKKQKENEV